MPDTADLCEIRFNEEGKGGAYTRAQFKIAADGTAENIKSRRFEDDPASFDSKKQVSAETVSAIKEIIEKNCMPAWPGLPQSTFTSGKEKTLTFVFSGGREVSIQSGYILPEGLRGAFFNIELELATKN